MICKILLIQFSWHKSDLHRFYPPPDKCFKLAGTQESLKQHKKKVFISLFSSPQAGEINIFCGWLSNTVNTELLLGEIYEVFLAKNYIKHPPSTTVSHKML